MRSAVVTESLTATETQRRLRVAGIGLGEDTYLSWSHGAYCGVNVAVLDKSLPERHFGVMPIYEYQCNKCRKVHEIWQKITEDPVKKCPSCGGKVERLISAVGFELKGGGWYKDGYASGKKGGGAAASSDAPAASSGDGEKKPKKAQSEKAEKAADVAAKNDKAPRTDPKHKSNSPKAKG